MGRKKYATEEERKAAERENWRRYREANREKRRERSRRYYAENREKARASTRRWEEANPDKRRESSQRWYHANRERALEKRREYHQNNREKIRQRKQAWYALNRERKLAKSKQWREANRERIHEMRKRWIAVNTFRQRDQHRRRNIRLAEVEQDFTPEDLRILRDYFEDRCLTCGCELNGKGQLDHWIPLMLGGATVRTNLVLLCKSCNLSKGAKLPDDFLSRNFPETKAAILAQVNAYFERVNNMQNHPV